jgi:hypothetical protein
MQPIVRKKRERDVVKPPITVMKKKATVELPPPDVTKKRKIPFMLPPPDRDRATLNKTCAIG